MKTLIKIITIIMINAITSVSAETLAGLDKDINYTKLDNGFRIFIYKNSEPPNRMSMRLVVNRGSAVETEEEQGIAHFLEHMAFKGTKNFPDGAMMEYFQRLGMAFGADTNAHTSTTETVYKIDMPEVKQSYIKDGLMLFRDYASEMLLEQKDIDSERGVILAEKTARDSASYRSLCAFFDVIYGDSIFAKRLPIGLEEVIKTADKPIFEKFYNENYTPENMSLIVVGDFDVAEMQKQASEAFSDIKVRAKTRPDVTAEFNYAESSSDYTDVLGRARLVEFTDRELKSNNLSLISVKNNQFKMDSIEARTYYIKLAIANYVLSKRLDRISSREDSPFTNAYVFSQVFENLLSVNFVEASFPNKASKATMELLARELAKVLKYGFYESEIAEAKAYYIENAQQALREKSTRKTPVLASSISSVVAKNKVFSSLEDRLALLEKVSEVSSLNDINEAFKEQYTNSDVVLFLSNTKNIDYDFKEVVNALLKEDIENDEEIVVGEFAYADMSNKADIKSENYVEDLGITQLVYDNNIRVNLKKTDYSANSIYVSVDFGDGVLGIKNEKELALARLSNFFVQGGLEAHSYEDIASIFVSNSIEIDFSTNNTNFSLGGYCGSTDIKEFLLLLKAYVEHPAFDEAVLPRIKKKLNEKYVAAETTAEGCASVNVMAWLSNAFTYSLPEKSIVDASTASDFRNWIEPYLKESYMEISIVGDFDEKEIKELLSTTFATLPKRAESLNVSPEQRAIIPQKAGASVDFNFNSDKPKSIAYVAWETCSMEDIDKVRAYILLSAILDDRMRVKIREENAIVYSPFSYNASSEAFDFGVMFAGSVVDVENVDTLLNLIESCADSLLNTEITQDEFERSKLPLVKTIEKTRRTNAYWLNNVLLYSQEYPQKLERARTIISVTNAFSVEDMNELAKSLFGGQKPYEIKVAPKKWEK